MSVLMIYLKNSGLSPTVQGVSEVILKSVTDETQYTLPPDVVINVNAGKQINKVQILDGVAVFERVTRTPIEIEFDFTFREISQTGGNIPKQSRFIFPLNEARAFMQQLWRKDEVLKVDNGYLNSIGVTNIIVNDMSLMTIRGNTDVSVKMKCFEDYYATGATGSSLIID